MRVELGFQIPTNWLEKMAIASQLSDMTSLSKSFDVVLFLLHILVTSPTFMSILSLAQEL